MSTDTNAPELTRDFTATAFVVWQGKVLLHQHKKLGMWLPCGGHIDPNELPDEAVKRESIEESGVEIELIGEKVLSVDEPVQLVRPRGIQLEFIHEGHEHIDLMYFARPVSGYDGYLLEEDKSLGWYGPDELAKMDLTEEIKEWTKLALQELA